MPPPASLPTRKLGKNGPEVAAVGLGLMGLSAYYGSPGSDEERLAFLDDAWELGSTNWDTSDLYGDSEILLGKWFALHPERRSDIFLATKFGAINATTTDSSPEYARRALDKSLERLGVECIDLYYVNRIDGKTPIEKTIKVLVELKKEGKINHIGLSECSSRSLRRACKIAHVDAVQIEYSPWDLSIENENGTHLLAACQELGVAVVAYAPLGRGFLTGQYSSPDDFSETDFRRFLPRFQKENFDKNLKLVEKIKSVAQRKGCTPGQLALAWLLAQGPDVIPIPGTKRVAYLEENIGALKVALTREEEQEIRAEIEASEVLGTRYPDMTRAQVYADSPEL
ncbi:hypothetical protein ACHAPT_010261 [Fusarium lateritium]